jgi:hypothetical protein
MGDVRAYWTAGAVPVFVSTRPKPSGVWLRQSLLEEGTRTSIPEPVNKEEFPFNHRIQCYRCSTVESSFYNYHSITFWSCPHTPQ